MLIYLKLTKEEEEEEKNIYLSIYLFTTSSHLNSLARK